MKIFKFLLIFSFLLLNFSVFSEKALSQDEGGGEVQINTPSTGATRDIFKGFDIPMPEIPTFTKEQLIEKMQFFQNERPSDDEYSGFRVFVPKKWKEASESIIRNTLNEEGRIIGEVARYDSDPNDPARSTVTVMAEELKHNISAKSWLLNYLIDSGYVMEGLNEISWNRAEALGVIYNDDSIDYKDRVLALVNGKRVLIITYSSPLFLWDQEKSHQATVLKSFNVLKHAKSFQEEMMMYDITGYAQFQYPSKWNLGTLNQEDFDRPNVKLINLEDFGEDMDQDGRKDEHQYSKGIINLQIVIYENTGTSITDEIENQKKVAENLSIKPGLKLDHNIDLVFPSNTEVNKLDIYEGVSNENNPNYEIWVAYMKNDEAYYFVTMLTPNRDSRYFAWTENKHAFESILSSFEPVSFYEE